MEKIQKDSCCLPDEILLNIFSRLSIKDVVSARRISKKFFKLLSSYYFTTTVRNPIICPNVLLVDKNTVSFLNLNQPEDFVVNTRHVRAPPLITLAAQECPDDFLSTNLKFHGSILGLVCLSVNHNYFVWNPNTGSCLKFPKPGFTTVESEELFSGIGDVGGGVIEIVRVSEIKNRKAGLGVPMVVDCLCTHNNQWTTLGLSACFLASDPTFLGVAQNVMLWTYPNINPTLMSGYHFPSRTVIQLAQPPQPSSRGHFVRLFLAADTIWALGESALDEVNYLWRMEGAVTGGRWERVMDLDMFMLPEDCGMVDRIVGSTADFRKLLVLCNFDYLLLLHVSAHGEEFNVTFVDQLDTVDSTTKTVNSVDDTYEFEELHSIQFLETAFWPWPWPRSEQLGRAAQAAEGSGALTQEHADSDHLEFGEDQKSC
ncbi:hypothetical protein vseg_019651 [Gypsophila vaccaria]